MTGADAGDTMADLVTEMNAKLAHLEPGPARTAAMNRLALDYATRAKGPGERAFWTAFLTPDTTECEACAGTGRYGFADDDVCPKCHGGGSVA